MLKLPLNGHYSERFKELELAIQLILLTKLCHVTVPDVAIKLILIKISF
jgi:hypothetical protein